MRGIHWALLLGIFLFETTGTAYAQSRERQRKFEPFLTRGETTWSIGAGYRHSDVEWNRASDTAGTATPNIETEQTWTDIQIIEFTGGVRHVEPADISFIRGGIQLEADLTGGLLMDGRSRISSYLGDNRTLEDTRQSYGSVDGYEIGGSVAAGYKIYLTGTPGWKARNLAKSPMPGTLQGRLRKERAFKKALQTSGPHISLTPLVGYAAEQTNYHREDAYNHVAIGPPIDLPVGPFNTKSDFITNWYGPFVGLEGEMRTQKHIVRLRGEIHDLTYYGKGEEPSRDDLAQDPSYDHDADGEGLLLKAEYAYALGEDYALTFDGSYRWRESDPGTYKLYFTDGTETTRRFNEITDESYAMHIGLRYNWD